MLRTMHRASHTSIFITSPVLLLRFHPPLHHKLVTQLSFVNAFVWQDQCELMVSLLSTVPVIYSFLFTTLSSLKCVIYLSSQKNLVISLRLHLKIYFSFFYYNNLMFSSDNKVESHHHHQYGNSFKRKLMCCFPLQPLSSSILNTSVSAFLGIQIV